MATSELASAMSALASMVSATEPSEMGDLVTSETVSSGR
jgi:hypothetical protein